LSPVANAIDEQAMAAIKVSSTFYFAKERRQQQAQGRSLLVLRLAAVFIVRVYVLIQVMISKSTRTHDSKLHQKNTSSYAW
jgi:hypothetical protein